MTDQTEKEFKAKRETLRVENGYKVISVNKDGTEKTLIDIKPDSGGRSTADFGICKSLYFLSLANVTQEYFGETEMIGDISELGKYLFSFIFALSNNINTNDNT